MKNLLLALTLASGTLLYAQTPRMCLYEEFTGENCPPCASTNPGLNKILLSPLNATKVIPIKWQVPIPSAPSATWSLYQTNKNDINWRYRGINNGGYGYISQNSASSGTSSGINSAPQGVMDGQHQWVFGAQTDHPAYISNAVIATAQSYSSAFSIDMKHDWNNSSMSAVIVTVNITASANFTSTGPLVFRCVMVERIIQFSVQPGTNGEKIFEDVAIAAFPTIQAGTSMSSTWLNGQTQSFVLTCNVPSYTRKKEEISMVGFIQDDGNRKIAQAARSMAVYDAVAIETSVPPVCTATFAPVISLKNAGLNAITAMTITPFVDGVAGNVTTWTGNLAYNNSTNVTLNALTTPTGSGAHSFSCVISAINGTDFDPTNNVLKVSFPVYDELISTNVAEGFVGTSFPPLGWTNANPNQGIGFSRTTQAGGYWLSNNAVKYDCFTNAEIGDVDELYLPPMSLEGGDAVQMSFDYAYAQKNANNMDKLEIFASKDCGATWVSIWSKSGTNLATSSPTAGAAYIPDQADFTQWRTEVLNLPGMNQSNVFVKFEVTNDNGNNMYIDNVNLVQNSPSSIRDIKSDGILLALFPNPASDEISLKITNAGEGLAEVKIMNLLGQELRRFNLQTNSGEFTAQLNLQGFSPGVYLLEFEKAGKTATMKFNIQ